MSAGSVASLAACNGLHYPHHLYVEPLVVHDRFLSNSLEVIYTYRHIILYHHVFCTDSVVKQPIKNPNDENM